MDELKISSRITNGIISKILCLIIKKKFGYKVSVSINDLDVVVNDEKTHIHIDADADMNSNEYIKIYRIIDESVNE